jgi:hypothetical protein
VAQQSAFHPQSRAGGGGGLLGAHIDHHVGDLLDRGETADDRGRAVLGDKVSASVMSSNGLGSKMPRLFTRMSASGTRLMKAATPSAVARSAATPSTTAPGTAFASAAMAAFTDVSERPLSNGSTRARTPLGNRKADARRRARDHRALAAQIDFHAVPSCLQWVLKSAFERMSRSG